jgi:membrane protein implicated in regulation of membrane protease activity
VILLIGVLLAVFVVPDGWEVPTVVGFGILEVAETTFWWRRSRREVPKVGAETLIGALGYAVTECRPTGTVRIQGEVWQAHCDAGIAAGQRVRVHGRDGLTLLVEPAD